jgi:hypothetical protein
MLSAAESMSTIHRHTMRPQNPLPSEERPLGITSLPLYILPIRYEPFPGPVRHPAKPPSRPVEGSRNAP